MTTSTPTQSTIGGESCNAIEDFEYTATYSPNDNKLRIYGDSRFDAVTLERVKAAGFRWAPNQKLWVAPMWTPTREDIALELAGVIEDEDMSLSERAAERAERFNDYSANRAADAKRARNAVSAIANNIPFGQPILVGHHSERHARKDAEKIENGMRRAINHWETSLFWERRAAGALAHAKHKELPGVRHRRIKGLEADKRKAEKNIAESKKFMAAWQRDGLTMERAKTIANFDHLSRSYSLAEYPRELPASQYEGPMGLWSALDGIITETQARDIAVAAHTRIIERGGRWVQHYENRIAYERAMLGETGAVQAEGFDIRPGGRVLIGGEWLVVLKVNKVAGRINSVKTTARYVSVRGIEEVKEYREPTEEESAKVAAVTKLAPIVNFPSEGFAHMTKADYDKVPKDYKGTNKQAATSESGAYRIRSALGVYSLPGEKDMNRRHSYPSVFITDMKRTDPPAAPAAPVQAVTFEREREASEVRDVRPTPTKTQEAMDFDAMREQLKTGVQIVSAPQLFPTPRELASRMVQLAELQPGDRVLEPSAGTGRLLEALPGVSPFPGQRQTFVEVVAVEISHQLAEQLGRSGLAGEVRCADFLSCTRADLGDFSAAILNPPFVNASDIEHIKHAFGMLRPGGRLVAICANGPRQNSQLRPLVENNGGLWEVLPSDTFKESGTAVNSVLLTLQA